MDKRILGRAYSRLIHKYFLNDMYLDLRMRAKKDTVDYIEAHLNEAMLVSGRRPPDRTLHEAREGSQA